MKHCTLSLWALFLSLTTVAQFQYTGGPINTDASCKAIWTDGDTAFVGYNEKLLRTFDGGESWEHLTNGIPSDADPRTIEVSNGHLIIGTNNGQRVYMSDDWGNSFDNGENTLNSLLVPTHAIGTSTLEMIGGTTHEPHIFDSETNSWTAVSAGGSLTHGLDHVAQNEIWQCTGGVNYGETRYSTDNGATWTLLNEEPQVDIGGGIMWSAISQAFIRVGDRIISGTNLNGFPVIFSDDNGVSWLPSDLGTTTWSDYGKRFIKVNDDHLITTNLSGLWKSTDQGETWTLIRILGQVNTMALFQGDHLLVGTENGLCEFADYGEGDLVAKHGDAATSSNLLVNGNQILTLSSGSLSVYDLSDQSWEIVASEDQIGQILGSEYVTIIGDNLIICGNGLQIASLGSYDFSYTSNENFSWQQPSCITLSENRQIVGSRSFSWTQAPRMWYSDDNGGNFTEASWTNTVAYGLGAIIDNHVEEFLSANGILLADMNAGYGLSTDNGTSWTHYGDTYSNTKFAVHDGVFYRYMVSGFGQDQFSLASSVDGISWVDMPTTGLPTSTDYRGIWSVNGDIFTYNDQNTPFGLYRYNPGTSSWELQIGTVGPNYPHLNFLLSVNGSFFGSWEGGGVWFTGDFPISVFETSEAKLSVYPNPSSGAVTISSDLRIQHIEVRSTAGTLVSEFTNTTKIDLGDLPGGIYLIIVRTEDRTLIERIILN